MNHDPSSNARAFAPPGERFDVVVVGAGPAGCAEAIAAARAGATTLLVDENPVPAAHLGLDVPLRYGGRFDASALQGERLIEAMVLADPALADAFDAGVDVPLGTAVWGGWVPGVALRAMPGRMLGLVAAGRSALVGFDRLVVATGARDLVLGFDGADLPGVVGAQGLYTLLTRYRAFSGRRVVVVGGGALAEATVALLDDHGLELVEQLRSPDGWVPLRAEGGVDRLVVARGDERRTIECDTVCVAIGSVPAIDLPAVLGCALTHDAARGGHVPVLDADGNTSVAGVRVVGEAAGTGADDRAAWMRALLATGGTAPLACVCEDVSRAAFVGVHPPRYLGHGPAGQAPIAAPHPDHLKRLTRAGMGPCQGRRCREQLALLLKLDGGEAVPLAGYRIPIRPVPLNVLAAADEPEALADHWHVWFDIPSMWTRPAP